MKSLFLYLLIILLLPINSSAQDWKFSSTINVTKAVTQTVNKTFHHLESSGRRNIAVSSNIVAIAWEDDRTATASIYLALKAKKSDSFSTELKISTDKDAYEPSLVALSDKRFAISWEADNKVWVRVVDVSHITAPKLGPIFQLPIETAMQSNLSSFNSQLFIAFSERFNRHNRIRLIQLEINSQQQLSLKENCLVDSQQVKEDQLYPSSVIFEHRIMLAWEDRRLGHTVIMASQSPLATLCQFTAPQRISKRPGARKLPYGKGHGVSRVALGQHGKSGILAAWADKRDFREGYDIYSAQYTAGKWGKNQRIQDDFGGVARQWHATIAGHNNGQLLVAWSDERDNNADILYSWFEAGEWSEDIAVPQASGNGEQNHPSICFDQQGDIHIAWIFRKKSGGITQLKYSMGYLN